MKERTTFETAQALKAAGFPQPEPEAGQMWYLGDSPKYLAGQELTDSGHFDGDFVFYTVGFPNLPLVNSREDVFESMVYAPTAADILREMVPQYSGWLIATYGIQGAIETAASVELCAAAWLELHKNPADLDEF